MKKKKQKKSPIKYVIFGGIILLIIGVTLWIALSDKKINDSGYRALSPASLPLIDLRFFDEEKTTLHGYVSEMSTRNMRDCIVPLDDNKGLTVSVRTFGKAPEALSYELRSLDGTEFPDSGKITGFEENGGAYEAYIAFSDLIEGGREYQLILTLTCAERDVRYYSRVYYAKNNYGRELYDFAREFSEANFDREKAAKFIVNYISPDDTMSTSDYSHVTLHSKYAMFTFENLDVHRNDDLQVRISEFEATQASLIFSYTVTVNVNGKIRSFEAEEFFAVRYRSGKVFLLDYYRDLHEIFSPDRATEEKGRILLGVGNSEAKILNSDNNTYTAFVIDRELWLYNGKTCTMNLLFSFKDGQDLSGRSDYGHHDIQVVKVMENGSVDFMVYGYMNRGIYEGQVGICFFRYDGERNTTDRLFYMPVYTSEQVLMMDLGTLAYVNQDDVCYIRYGDGIYSIDLRSGESVEVSIRAYPGTYAMNENGNVVAWQEGSSLTYPDRLVILNMDTQTTAVVNADAGEYLKVLSFIGNDIIYGFGNREDSVISANVDMQQLLTRLVIASTDEKLEIRENYEAEDCFITGASVKDTRVSIHRVKKKSSGQTEKLADDVLLLTQDIIDPNQSKVLSRVLEPCKKEYYIQIGRTLGVTAAYTSTQPEIEVQKEINVLTLKHQQSDVYYVYGYGKLRAVESEVNVAVREAFDVFGAVVDENMNYLWNRGTRDLIKTIAIKPSLAEEGQGSLGTALSILCAQKGMTLPAVEEDLKAGKSPFEIIDSALGAGSAANLFGCTLQEMLYFINVGRPVLAIIGDRDALVITGYDTDTVSIYYPYTGKTLSQNQRAAEAYFSEKGYSFISYK